MRWQLHAFFFPFKIAFIQFFGAILPRFHRVIETRQQNAMDETIPEMGQSSVCNTKSAYAREIQRKSAKKAVERTGFEDM